MEQDFLKKNFVQKYLSNHTFFRFVCKKRFGGQKSLIVEIFDVANIVDI